MYILCQIEVNAVEKNKAEKGDRGVRVEKPSCEG